VIEGVKLAAAAGTSLDSITEVVRENGRFMRDVLSVTKSQSRASGQALELLEGTRSELEQIRVACSEQVDIAGGVSQDSVALGAAAHEVLQATAGQADQSARIVEIVETVRGEVERNSRSLLEQTAAFAEAKERLKCVNERAGANQESVDQVQTAVYELLQLAERLRAEIERLRC